jgi:hypothetical protein
VDLKKAGQSGLQLLIRYRSKLTVAQVYRTPADVAEDVVHHAMKVGYRHVSIMFMILPTLPDK